MLSWFSNWHAREGTPPPLRLLSYAKPLLTRFSSALRNSYSTSRIRRQAGKPIIFNFDFRALRHSELSAGVPESQNWKRSVSQPGIESLSHRSHFGTDKNGLILSIYYTNEAYQHEWASCKQDTRRSRMLAVCGLRQAVAKRRACPCTTPWVSTRPDRTASRPSERPRRTVRGCSSRLVEIGSAPWPGHASPEHSMMSMNLLMLTASADSAAASPSCAEEFNSLPSYLHQESGHQLRAAWGTYENTFIWEGSESTTAHRDYCLSRLRNVLTN